MLSGVAVCECVNLAPRAPYTHHLRSVVPWFVKGLRWFDELFARPRADPRVRCAWFGVTQNHSLPSSLHVCVEGAVSRAWFFAAWSWIPPCCVLCSCSVRRREYLVAEPVPRRSAHCAFRQTLLCSVTRDRALDCSGTSGSRRHPSQVISLSTGAIVVWLSLLRPPGSRVPPKLCATLRSCRRCVWLCASWSAGTPRRRHARIDRPVYMSGGACFCWSLVLLPCLCCSPQQARPAPRPVAAHEYPLREALWKVFCSLRTHSELLLSPHCDSTSTPPARASSCVAWV